MIEWWLRVDEEQEEERSEAMLVYAELSKCFIMPPLTLFNSEIPHVLKYEVGALSHWTHRALMS